MKWLDMFCEDLRCTDHFKRQLQSQLSRQFSEETGISLDGFVLVPPAEGEAAVYFDEDGIAYLDTDLVGADAHGFSVSIAWQCPGRERVLPSNPSPESHNEVIRAWWKELPVDDLRQQYGSPGHAPWPSSADFPFHPGDYSFDVQWKVFPWPDVWLELETGHPAFPRSADLVVETLENVRKKWNQAAQADPTLGIVHNLATQRQVISPISIVINIDFGSATPKALVEMLNALQQVAQPLAIRRVVCRAFESV